MFDLPVRRGSGPDAQFAGAPNFDALDGGRQTLQDIGRTDVASVDGGPETQLTEWELFAANPDWTPDGRIVFDRNDLGSSMEAPTST